MPEQPQDPEQRIRDAFTAGRLEDAAIATLSAYSAEIMSFLAARLQGRSHAQEVFSMFAEDLWTGLANFGWRCSMRTWAYTLARNAATRYAAAPVRRRVNNFRLSSPGVEAEFLQQLRHTTRVYLRTEVKSRFRALRARLDADDQMLLVLRVDRGMSWRDLALTINGDVDLDEEIVQRESARLRKAFERVKLELRRMADREGLLGAKE